MLGVNGLQPFLRARTFHSAATPATDNHPPYKTGEILSAYGANGTGLTGAGQKIGIIIDVAPLTNDLTTFWTDNNVNQSLSNYSTENVPLYDSSDADGREVEETLDVSWSSGIASQAQVEVFVTGQLSGANVDSAYSQIASELKAGTQPALHQISMSYGANEDEYSSGGLEAEAQYFATIASYGVSIFASSGDNGAFDLDGNVSANYPASDVNVTGVGGTSLFLDSLTGLASTETAWSADGYIDEEGRIGASGGGVSTTFQRPTWQVGTGLPSGSFRCVPDVSCAGDPEEGAFLIYTDPESGTQQQEQYGGTSWSSPVWAGFCALLNQARANAGQTALGPLNPHLYPLLGTSSFRDITQGSNGHYEEDDGYSCTVGYDLVTGIGVPNIAVLAGALTGTSGGGGSAPIISSPATASGQVGVAFSYQITASNAPTSFAASNLPAGLGVDAGSGLITGTPTAAGTSTATISAGNATGIGSATLTITVAAASGGVPTITGFSPTSGPVGTTVTINGTNFPGSLSVIFTGGAAASAIVSSTQAVTTVPEGAETGPITLVSQNGSVSTATGFTVTLPAAPVITSALTASGAAGSAFSYQITASNSPTSFSADGLPEGLVLDSTTGAITGTPLQSGTFTVTLDATNDTGDDTATLLLTITASQVPGVNLLPLYSFSAYSDDDYTNTDGVNPAAGLALGKDGNLYGVTQYGGVSGNGTVFQITPAGVLTTLHSFSFGTDGEYASTGLILGKDGNFYGTTSFGGDDFSGTVFQVTPTGDLTTLYAFTDGNDGDIPGGPLVQGNDGNFYGTTSEGGANGGGTVFVMTPAGILTPLYSFSLLSDDGYTNTDGAYPAAGLVQGIDGNFYGTTPSGGTYGGGTLFQITPGGVLKTLYNFGASDPSTGDYVDGADPLGTLVQDSAGVLHGTTRSGGANDNGTVFGITTQGTLSSLYSFSAYDVDSDNTNKDGSNPSAGLILDGAGNLYGTTAYGGTGGAGTVFQVSPAGAVTTLHDFSTGDGADCTSGLVLGNDGNLYGTTVEGGAHGNGTVFQILRAPTIASLAEATANLGQPFSYQIVATGTPTSYAATGLPAGLGVDAGTGLISGTPTAAGVFPVTLSATNTIGTATGTLNLLVTAVAPAITSATAASGQVSVAFSYQITASNAPTSFAASNLPAGLGVDAGSGLITGTPTTAGTSTATISSGNATGIGSATLTITIGPSPFVPTVTGFSPASGPVGTTVTITGTNFLLPLSVSFGGNVPATSSFTPTEIVVIVPAGAQTGPIMVTDPYGDAATATNFVVTAPGVPVPVFTSATAASAQVGPRLQLPDRGERQPDELRRERLACRLVGEHRHRSDHRHADGGRCVHRRPERHERRRHRHGRFDPDRCGGAARSAGDHQRPLRHRAGGAAFQLPDHGQQHAGQFRRHEPAVGSERGHRHRPGFGHARAGRRLQRGAQRGERGWHRPGHPGHRRFAVLASGESGGHESERCPGERRNRRLHPDPVRRPGQRHHRQLHDQRHGGERHGLRADQDRQEDQGRPHDQAHQDHPAGRPRRSLQEDGRANSLIWGRIRRGHLRQGEGENPRTLRE